MVRGLETFKEFFAGFEDQYVLIGGAACDILFSSNEGQFRATRDLDIVLIVEALTQEFGENIDSRDIKKHKNDILRISTEFLLGRINILPETVQTDIRTFVRWLEEEPFDATLLQNYGLKNQELVDRLGRAYMV